METDFLVLVAVLAGISILDAVVILFILLTKRGRKKAYAARNAEIRRFRETLLARDGKTLIGMAKQSWASFAATARLSLESFREDQEALDLVRNAFRSSGIEARALRRARSPFIHRRVRSYLSLGLIGSPKAAQAMLVSLRREKSGFARLVLLSQIARSPEPPDPGILLPILENASKPFRSIDYDALKPISHRFRAYFDREGEPKSEVGIRLYLMGIAESPTETGWRFAKKTAEESYGGLGESAAAVMAAVFPPSRVLAAFAERTETRFMRASLAILGTMLEPRELRRLDPFFEREDLREDAIRAAAEIDRRHPEQSERFLEAIAEGAAPRAAALSRALEYRLPYFAHHQPERLHPGFLRMASELLSQDRAGSILALLEDNPPPAVRTALVSLVKDGTERRPALLTFFSRHSSKALLEELGLPPPPPEESRPRIPVSVKDKAFIGALVVLALAIFPGAFMLRHGHELHYLSRPEAVHRFIFDFHYLFAYYTIVINSLYLVLMLLSGIKLAGQSRMWETGLKHLLLSSRFLPKMTIIAPAFNEEATIADSVESLLSLAYPDYEVIVVNDGSRDRTLETAIATFEFEPITSGSKGGIACMPVKSVYRSRKSPNLFLVDKTNGGKADALNAGINQAAGDYVCCIDADSLLDPEALIRAMFQALTREKDVIAMGGNILPINGCVVERGHLQRIGLPGHPLAAFQTIEYLRSFVSGRLGWALVDGLLIISGAFGIFRKDRVLEAGGYMTGKGIYKKDTVGEDMELVVRLLRQEREAGRKGCVDYCYNANCWTEVPEDGTALGKQRDRWHRGLIEVLLHHRRMAFRARYGTSGIFSVPYFYTFELVGPWIELSGYIVLAASLALSLIDPLVSLTVFAIAVQFGILISVSSVLLAERQIVYFRPLEFLRLIALAFAENFGFRQLMSLSRSWAFVQFFYKTKGWQKFSRKGFVRTGGGS